jgi:hypothetical protein
LPPGFRANALSDPDIRVILSMQKALFGWSQATPGILTKARDPKLDPVVERCKRPMHKSYLGTSKAVDTMLAKLRDQRVGFVLPKQLVQATSTRHQFNGKWTSKDGKMIGRNIVDMSYGEPPYLNGKWAKNLAADFYGKIEHLTLSSIVLMILDMFDKLKAEDPMLIWEDMTMWIMDIASAYSHLGIPPRSAHLFVQEIVGNKVFVHSGGVFGGSVITTL